MGTLANFYLICVSNSAFRTALDSRPPSLITRTAALVSLSAWTAWAASTRRGCAMETETVPTARTRRHQTASSALADPTSSGATLATAFPDTSTAAAPRNARTTRTNWTAVSTKEQIFTSGDYFKENPRASGLVLPFKVFVSLHKQMENPWHKNF